MAANNKDDDLDLAIDQESGSKKKLIILIAAGVLLLSIVGAAVAFFLLGDDEETEDAAESAEQVEQAPLIYHPLQPGFVVNLPPGGKAKLLQADIQVVARDQETIDFLKLNDPMIRHNLLNLLGSHPDSDLRPREGKEKLQAELLKQLNKIIKSQGATGEIEAVYFTAFVMQ